LVRVLKIDIPCYIRQQYASADAATADLTEGQVYLIQFSSTDATINSAWNSQVWFMP